MKGKGGACLVIHAGDAVHVWGGIRGVSIARDVTSLCLSPSAVSHQFHPVCNGQSWSLWWWVHPVCRPPFLRGVMFLQPEIAAGLSSLSAHLQFALTLCLFPGFCPCWMSAFPHLCKLRLARLNRVLFLASLTSFELFPCSLSSLLQIPL